MKRRPIKVNTYYYKPQRHYQTDLARIVLSITSFLVAVLVLALLSSFLSRPASAQEGVQTVPPYQRCDKVGKIAYTAVWARDAGRTAQDTHLKLDPLDPVAATIVDRIYFNPNYGNVTPDIAQDATREACLKFY